MSYYLIKFIYKKYLHNNSLKNDWISIIVNSYSMLKVIAIKNILKQFYNYIVEHFF